MFHNNYELKKCSLQLAQIIIIELSLINDIPKYI